jgi:hypothetical protein
MTDQLIIVFAYASFVGITLLGHGLLLQAVWPRRARSRGRAGRESTPVVADGRPAEATAA